MLEELKLLAGVLGVARDAEVLAERYERTLTELPSHLVRGPVGERLVDGAKRRYQAGLKRSLTAMRSERYFRLLDALDDSRPPARPATTSGEPPQQTTVASAYRKVRKAAKAAHAAKADPALSAEQKDEALHRIRKGAKRLRYTAAATGARDVAEGAKRIQTLLGDHQDSVVSRAHLSTEASAAHSAGEDTFTYGLLYQIEDELARTSEGQLDDALTSSRRRSAPRADPGPEWPRGRTSWPVSRILFPSPLLATGRRPSIWAHRRRVPRAAYPQARASSPLKRLRSRNQVAAFLALLRVGFA